MSSMEKVKRCEQASARWTAWADAAPDGSWREKVYRYFARQAERDANIAYLEVLRSQRSPVRIPVRVERDDR